MKKRIFGVLLVILTFGVLMVGCETEADRVSYNLSQEADNFNVVRQLTVINCLQGDVLFQMTGKMSIKPDMEENQLEIIVENEDGTHTKHFVGLSDNVTYVVEQISGEYVNKYKYTLVYNPRMWVPVPDIKIED